MKFAIREITVGGLFGQYQHAIPISNLEGVSIIIGPNGIGKTVMLQMIFHLHAQDFSALGHIPFDNLTVSYSSGARIEVHRRTDRVDEYDPAHQIHMVFNWFENDELLFSHETILGRVNKTDYISQAIDQYLPFLGYVGSKHWKNIETNELLGVEDILDRYGEFFPVDIRYQVRTPPWLAERLNAVSVRYIDTQRLMSVRKRRANQDVVPAVREIAADLSSRIKAQLANYATFSQSLDRSYPERLVKHLDDLLDDSAYSAPSVASLIESALVENERRRRILLENGLIDAGEEPYYKISETLTEQAGILLSLYIEDVSKKLDFFQNFSDRVQLLRKLVRSKFLNKELRVDKEVGIRIFVEKSQKELPLDALSSGEQHELILLYDLLFRVEAGTLVLIDEPELSFHIDWQEHFLRDLIEIAKLSQFQTIIATHSPHLIYDRWDLAIPLSPSEEPRLELDAHQA